MTQQTADVRCDGCGKIVKLVDAKGWIQWREPAPRRGILAIFCAECAERTK